MDSAFSEVKKKLINGASDLENAPDSSILRTNGPDISRFNKNGTLLELISTTQTYRNIMSVNDSTYYLHGRLGLNVLDNHFNVVADPVALQSLKISRSLLLNDTLLFVATFGNGFKVMNNRNWTSTVSSDELSLEAANIYDAKLHDRKIWLVTDGGLMILDADSLIGGTINITVLTKDMGLGLLSDKINFIHLTNDACWLINGSGYTVVPFTVLSTIAKAPKFYLKKIQVNGQEEHGLSLTDLDYHENNLELSFGFISYNNPNIFIRYRLNPKELWAYSDERTVQFSSLAPGNYSWELETSPDKVHWSPVQTGIVFMIHAPWYTQWYSILALIVVLVGIVYFYFRNKLRSQKEKQVYLSIINEHQHRLIQSEIETLERERNRISKELHDSVSTNLIAIKMTVSHALEIYGDKKKEAIDGQFQDTIKELKDIIYDLNPPGIERYGLHAALKNYVDQLSESLPSTIHLNFFGTELRDTMMNMSIFRIVQELLGNTLKHAEAQNISIHINIFPDLISLVYEDDGIGFQNPNGPKGLGLDNIESRVTAMNGTMRLDTGKFGTSYSIDIPLTKTANSSEHNHD